MMVKRSRRHTLTKIYTLTTFSPIRQNQIQVIKMNKNLKQKQKMKLKVKMKLKIRVKKMLIIWYNKIKYEKYKINWG